MEKIMELQEFNLRSLTLSGLCHESFIMKRFVIILTAFSLLCNMYKQLFLYFTARQQYMHLACKGSQVCMLKVAEKAKVDTQNR
jgi:hypothetical protein